MMDLLNREFEEGKCPIDHVVVQPVTTMNEYFSKVGLLSARPEEVRQFRDLAALQVGIRSALVDVVSRGIHKDAPSLEPLVRAAYVKKLDQAIDDLTIDLETSFRGRDWNAAGADRASVAIYSNPETTWLLVQAAVQLLVAVRGLAKQVCDQQQLPVVAASALYIHMVLDAFLAIGCLLILFSVIPAENRLVAMMEDVLQEIHELLSGPFLDRISRFLGIWFSEGFMGQSPPPGSQSAIYFQDEAFPLLQPGVVSICDKFFGCLGKLHTPDIAVEQLMLVKLLIMGGIFYGVLYGTVGKVGPHVLVTSPAVLMGEDGVDPADRAQLVFQLLAKTTAALVPYIIAASSWLEFRMVGAMMFAVYLQNSYVYYIALVLYAAMLISSGIVAVAHYGQDKSVPDDIRHEELHAYPPQQGCCAVDRKRHKPAADALATRAVDMEAGAGQRLLHQPTPGYSACA